MGWKTVARVAMLLLLLLSAACGAPEAAAPPTLAPPQIPTPIPPTSGAEPGLASPTATLVPPPTFTPGPAPGPTGPAAAASPQPSLDPTQAYCRMDGMAAVNTCAVMFATPPPTPAVPLERAVKQLTGHLVLYTRNPGFVMLGDADRGVSIWLNGAMCPFDRTINVAAEWSADGRYIAFICQDLSMRGVVHVFDLQTAGVRRLAEGDAVAFEWAPRGSRLLVAEQDQAQRGFVLDVATGAMAALPAGPLWKRASYPPLVVGPVMPQTWYIEKGAAAMAWSDDGTKVAVIADLLYVLDADPRHAGSNSLPILASFNLSSIARPMWSRDGRSLYLIVPRQNHNNPLAPSSMYGAATLRLDINTGAITETLTVDSRDISPWYAIGGPPVSPDGKLHASIVELADQPVEHRQWILIQDQAGQERARFEGGFAQWQPRLAN